MKTSPKKTRWILVSLLLAVVILSLSALLGTAAYTAARNMVLSGFTFQTSGPTIVDPQATPTVTAQANIAPSQAPILAPDPTEIAPSLTPWDGTGRVTILLLGLDFRDWETKTDYSRSDTMILLTLDPVAKTAGMLSIPRDMWVAIPGYQHGKINTAYYLGQAHKLPGGGPALAIKTVEQFLGVPINYYAQIDFGAFVRFIDEIGGVTIDVPNQITISLQGEDGIKGTKTLQPGRQVLPGQWALAYARNRHTEEGDFDRARRQQQVLMAVRERMLDRNMLPDIIKKAPVLYKELAAGIHTNLQLDEVIRLALAVKDVSMESITQGVLGKDTVVFGSSPDDLSILIPIPDKIHLLRDKIFSSASSMQPATPGDSLQRMQAEAARIGIYNGSKDGTLAARTGEYLQAQGANVVATGEADKAYSSTTLVDYTGSPFTLSYLVELIGNPYIRILSQFDPDSEVDVEIFLGADWARQNSLP